MKQTAIQYLVVISVPHSVNNTTITLAVDSYPSEDAEKTAEILMVTIANKYNKRYDQNIDYNEIKINSICRIN